MPLEELGEKAMEMLSTVAEHGTWTAGDRETLRSEMQDHWGKKSISDKFLDANLKWWSRAAEFGDQLLSALCAYQEAFFAEEERRIRPVLEEELQRAQSLAERVTVRELLETLSQGIRYQTLPQKKELILAPSFWGAPFIFFGAYPGDTTSNRELIVFGARPKDASLIPGEIIPDSLVNALKALSDPTRLRILRYVTSEPLTPTQLARRLRLRAPTVIHHLHILRSAGLVYVMVGEGKEKAYQSRSEGVVATCDLLAEFLNDTNEED
jgi:DNA-binding transcriptional ArsR family regulator